jgi:hypothetical protein
MDTIYLLLTQCRYAEAWQLLKKDTGKTGAKLFNQALCLIAVKKYGEALKLLDEAMTKQGPASPGPFDETSRLLLEEQHKNETFPLPVMAAYPGLFPEQFSDHVRRLKIYCCAGLEHWSLVLTLAAQLRHKKYPDVEQAVLLAENKIAGKRLNETPAEENRRGFSPGN